MNYLEKWQHNNQEYLTKVLLWLRLCLKRQVQTLEKGKEILENSAESLLISKKKNGKYYLPKGAYNILINNPLKVFV